MKDVETRVTKLELDSKDFEKDAKKALSTIKELKKGLEFENASKGAKKVSESLEEVNENLDELDKKSKNANKKLKNDTDHISKNYDNISESIEGANDNFNDFSKNINKNSGTIDKNTQNISENFVDISESINDSNNNINEFSKSVESNSKNISDKFNNIGESVAGTTEELSDADIKLIEMAKSTGNLDKAFDEVDASGLMEAITDIQNKVSYTGTVIKNILGDAVDWVQTKFNGILSPINQKLDDIYNSTALMTFGSGFDKMEAKTQAIKTTLGAVELQGKKLEDVERTVDKLSWYADETSYSITDMTSALSKFTSAGVDLDISATAIMGIANVAAKAGIDANRASGAFYNLSQAIGQGALKTQDWISLENLSFTTEEFRQQAIQAALANKTLKEYQGRFYDIAGNEVTTANMKETLADGWFTTEVMLEVFGKYAEYTEDVYDVISNDTEGIYNTCADAMKAVSESGKELSASAFKAGQESRTLTDAIAANQDAISSYWSNIFGYIFGDVNEQTEIWTKFNSFLWDTFASGLSETADAFGKWYDNGFRETFWESINRSVTSISKAISNLATGFRKIISPGKDVYERIVDITNGFSEFSYNLEKFVERHAPSFIKMGEAIAAVLDIIRYVFSQVIGFVKNTVDSFDKFMINTVGVSLNLWSIIDAISTFIIKLHDVIVNNKIISESLRVLSNIIGTLAAILVTGLGVAVEYIIKLFDNLKDVLKDVYKFLEPALTWIADKAEKVKDSILNLFRSLKPSKEKTNVEKTKEDLESLNEKAVKFKQLIKEIYDKLKEKVKFENLDTIKESLGGAGTTVKQKVKGFGSNLKNRYKEVKNEEENKLIESSEEGTEFTNEAIEKNKTFFENIVSIVSATARGIAGLISKVAELVSKLTFQDILDFIKTAAAFFAGKGFYNITTSIGEAIEPVANLGYKIGGILDGVKGSLKAFQTELKSKALLNIGEAILMIAGAISLLSLIDPSKASTASLIIAGLIEVLVTAMRQLSKIDTQQFASINKEGLTASSKGGVSSSLGLAAAITALAGAVLIISVAVAGLSFIKPEKLVAGITAITVVMSAMVGSLITLNKLGTQSSVASFAGKSSGSFTSSKQSSMPIAMAGFAMAEIASALLLITPAIIALSFIPKDKLLYGVGAIVAILTALTASIVAINYFLQPKKKDVSAKSTLAAGGAAAAQIHEMAVLLESLGKFLIELAASIAIITGVMSLKPEETKLAILGILSIVLLMTEFLKSISESTKGAGKDSDQNVKQLRKIISSMGLMLMEVAIAIKMIAGSGDSDQLLIAFLGVAGVILLMLQVLDYVSNHKTNKRAMDNFSNMVSSLSKSLILIGVAIAIVSGFKVSTLIKSVGAYVGVIAALVGALVLIKKSGINKTVVNNFAKGILSLSASLLVFSVAIDTLVIGLMAMKLLDWSEFGKFAAIVGVLSVVIGAIGALTSKMPGMAAGMMAFSTSVLFLGLGMLFLVGAMTLLGAAGPAAALGISVFLVGLTNSMIECLHIIVKNLPGLVKSLKDAGMDILKTLLVSLQEMINTFAEAAPGLLEAVWELWTKIFDFLHSHLSDFIANIITLICDILEGITRKVGDFISSAVDLLIAIINALADKITASADEIADALLNLLKATLELLCTLVTKAGNEAIKFGKELANEIWDGIVSVMESLGDWIVGILSPVFEWIDEKIDAIVTWLGGPSQKEIDKAQSEVDKLYRIYSANQWAAIRLSPEPAKEYLTGLMKDNSEYMAALGDTLVRTGILVKGIDSKGNYGLSYVEDSWEKIKDTSLGKTFIKEYGDDEKAKWVFDKIGTRLATAFNEGLCKGIYEGMFSDKLRGGVNSITQSAKYIEEIYKDELKIHSPSRVAKEIGDYWSQGLAIGMMEGIKNIENAAENSSKVMIRPVFSSIDDSNINSMLRSYSASFNGLGNLTNSINFNSNDTNVVNAIRDLHEQMADMNDNLTDMQIVLDSGELVGGIASPMDRTLGLRTRMKIRGV